MRVKLIVELKEVKKWKYLNVDIDKSLSPYEQEEPILRELEKFVNDVVKVSTYTNRFPYQVAIQLEKARIVRHFKENQVKKTPFDQLVFDTIWNNIGATYELLGRGGKK